MKNIKIRINDLNFLYKKKPVLKGLKAEVEEKAITTIIGPSGVGKTTLLMVINRLYESIPGCRIEGQVEIKINDRYIDVHRLPFTTLRKKVGMVFQIPNPLPMSIFKNIAFPMKLSGLKDKDDINDKVEQALKEAFLWDEAKDRLNDSALELSGGQQQRLCIARAMIMQPEVLLLDEPTSSLDMEAASKITELLKSLKKKCTLIVVSHYTSLTRKISDNVLTLKNGCLEITENSNIVSGLESVN